MNINIKDDNKRSFFKKTYLSLITAGVITLSSSANAHTVIDPTLIQTVYAQTQAQLLEMGVMIKKQVMSMNLDKMLANLKIKNDQNIAANQIARETQLATDLYNLELARSLKPSRGICGAVSASLKMGTSVCDQEVEGTKISKKIADKYILEKGGKSDSNSTQLKNKLEGIEKANSDAMGSRVQMATVGRALLGQVGNLSQKEFEVVKASVEAMKRPVRIVNPEYDQDNPERMVSNYAKMAKEQIATDAALRSSIVNLKDSNGNSQMALLKSAVYKYYGPSSSGQGGIQPTADLAAVTAENADVNLAIKELLTVNSIGLYIDYLTYESSLRIESLIGNMMLE